MTTNGTTAPLTEAELAEIEAATSEDCLGPYPLACPLEYGEIWGLVADIPRLLADLRRAQKRIAELEAIPTIGPCKCAEPHVVDGLIPACAVCAQPISFYRLSSATVTGLATVEIEQCRKRIAELEAQIAATAEAHREDQRRTDELTGVPG